MSDWARPDLGLLQQVVQASQGELILCSPFIRRNILDAVHDLLPEDVKRVSVLTKLDFRDWLVGASEPDGLLDFAESVLTGGRDVAIWHGSRLHAKAVISGGPHALAGSANLTMGGYRRNQELVRLIDGGEVEQLRPVVDGIRRELVSVSLADLQGFVTQCETAVETQEALLELIREEASPLAGVVSSRGQLVSYPEFWDFLEESTSPLASEILDIAKNRDGNNNTGKIKQTYFGVQRFLQEYPSHRAYVEALRDDSWFDVREAAFFADWTEFLVRFQDETSTDHMYSIATLRRYLPVGAGGLLVGGGGRENQLKRVWPFVGRVMRAYDTT